MLSLYLCSIAVVVSFVIGSGLGIIAAQNDWFSRVMRPINDTLQTMPPFVLLIPIVMIFKIGEFTALLAVIAYAYVPAFRYTEHGLRHVSETVVEAASSFGTTRTQALILVKLPLALPNIMLGLNQSIMYGIAMLVITALVGTNGLGQEVYVGLSAGNFGQGFVAGVGMAIIAITADRFCKAWQRNNQNHFQKV
jgi:glycine betaine/proline transport system permease protein